jgi:hypothetical protein
MALLSRASDGATKLCREGTTVDHPGATNTRKSVVVDR